ncbi:MAG: carbohydrate deacetylase [Candidatus Eremiobacterota bacterium]
MKYLIVNADDYNLTEDVSRGIIEASRNGIVTSTTVMVNIPGFDKTLDLLSNSSLSAGIHFNLTFGEPVCNDVPALVNKEGRFNRRFEIEPEHISQVVREIEAQYNRFLASGIKPSHFDSHHHVHTKPELKKIFFDFAREKNLPMRSRAGAHKDETSALNIKTPDYFYENFYGDQATVSTMEYILKNLKDGMSEIMCHPGYNTDSLEAISSYACNREKELSVLTDAEILKLVDELHIKLINYEQLIR